MAKVHGWAPARHQPNPDFVRMNVDVALHEIRTTPDIWWSPRANSYVLAEVQDAGQESPSRLRYHAWNLDGRWVQLLSINGSGEVRWDVPRYNACRALEKEHEEWFPRSDDAESLAAARHFNLPLEIWKEEE